MTINVSGHRFLDKVIKKVSYNSFCHVVMHILTSLRSFSWRKNLYFHVPVLLAIICTYCKIDTDFGRDKDGMSKIESEEDFIPFVWMLVE